MTRTPFTTSPYWSKSTKRLITAVLLVLAFLLVYWVRGLLIFLLLAVILAYLLLPLVNLLHRQLRLPRLAAIALVYLGIVALLISIPVTTAPQIIVQFNAFVANTPRAVAELEQALARPIIIGDNEFIPNEWPPLQEAFNNFGDNLINIAQTIGTRSVGFLRTIATATLSTVGWILVVLFISFYMIKDYQLLFTAVLDGVPAAYRDDVGRLARELSAIWNAFLRGQLILFAIMGTTVFTLATLVGLPNALFLGLVSGLAEFLPQIGATLAMIPAVLIAFFQSDGSWLGRQMSPFLFMLLIGAGYILLQQIENYLLVPRVIGHQLKLHPLVVFVAALVGARSAGILGILVAAPILASGRLILRYVYAKLLDQNPFPDDPAAAPFLLRPARADDRAAVTAIAAQTWEGQDYVADAFDDWLADPDGQVTVAERDGVVAGLGKLTRLGPGEWWLEGLRVAPEFRRQGVGRLLHHHGVALADEMGSGTLRFATDGDNHVIHRIAAETGFRQVSRHLIAEIEPGPAAAAGRLQAVSAGELVAWTARLRASPTFRQTGGLVECDWTWLEALPRLAAWQADGCLFSWQNGVATGEIILGRDDDGGWLLTYFAVPDAAIPDAARDVAAFVAAQGGQRLRAKPLATAAHTSGFLAAGWRIDPHQMLVFERPLRRHKPDAAEKARKSHE